MLVFGYENFCIVFKGGEEGCILYYFFYVEMNIN